MIHEEDRANKAKEDEKRDEDRALCREKIREIMLKVERDREERMRN